MSSAALEQRARKQLVRLIAELYLQLRRRRECYRRYEPESVGVAKALGGCVSSLCGARCVRVCLTTEL